MLNDFTVQGNQEGVQVHARRNTGQSLILVTLIYCLNALTIAQLVSEPKAEREKERERAQGKRYITVERKHKSSVLKLFEMTKSTAAGRLMHSRITVARICRMMTTLVHFVSIQVKRK